MTRKEEAELTATLYTAMVTSDPKTTQTQAVKMFRVIRRCTYRQEIGEQRKKVAQKTKDEMDGLVRLNVAVARTVLRR